jgi:hypothetical protein
VVQTAERPDHPNPKEIEMAKKIVPAQKAAQEQSTDDAMEEVLALCKKAPALFTEDAWMEIEAAINADRFGVTRRMAFALLSKSGADLMKVVRTDREFAVAVAAIQENIGDYASALRGLLSWMEAASVRSACALARRRDMDAVFRDGEKSNQRAEVAHG